MAYGDELNFSAVDNLDRAMRASGKLGGVAGVFAGAHNCNENNKIWLKIIYIKFFLTIIDYVTQCSFYIYLQIYLFKTELWIKGM